MTWEETLRICDIFVKSGIKKIRITGGEPFVRKGLINFLIDLKTRHPWLKLGITTNGSLIHNYFDQLQETGLKHLNFSLDTMREETFQSITGRTNLAGIIHNIETAYQKGFVVKINTVVLPGYNVDELANIAEWTQHRKWDIRFIEAMPFDTRGGQFKAPVRGDQILSILKEKFEVIPLKWEKNSVGLPFRIPGYAGRIGIIQGFSRTFCQDCSRIRVSAKGLLRTCLYCKNKINLLEMLRTGHTDTEILKEIKRAILLKKKDGHEEAKVCKPAPYESMSAIGG